MWHAIPSTTKLQASALVNYAQTFGYEHFMIKSEGTFYSLVNCSEEEKNSLLETFVLPDIPKDYEEDETEDLNLLLDEMRTLPRESQKSLALKSLVMEIKRLTDRNRIVVAKTDEGEKFIRRVGKIKGDTLEFTGDTHGMTIWNNLSLSQIKTLRV